MAEMAESRSSSASKSPKPKRPQTIPAKRKPADDASQPRAHQACSICKSRKARCDSRRPRCSFCEGRDLQCVYPPLYKRALCSQSHVDKLEAQVQQLQARLQQEAPSDTAYGQNRTASPPPSPYNLRSQSDGKQQFQVAGEQISRTDYSQHDSRVLGPSRLTTETILQDPQALYEQEHLLLSHGQSTLATDGRPASLGADDNDGTSDVSDHMPATDGMVEYAQSSPEGDETDGRYGDSYSLKFAMRVKASTMHARSSLAKANQFQRFGDDIHNIHPSMHAPREAAQSRDDEDDMTALRSYLTAPSLQDLPRRHLAKTLVDCYFADVHPVWPFLIEDDTRAELEQTYTSEDPGKPISIAKLNLMFALGCQFSPSLAETGDPVKGASEVGTVFYRTARAFIVANAFNMCSIGMLQALLLMAQYQQGTMRGKQFWLTISHATRIAQCLGFHLDSRKASLSPLDGELGRRLWWGCFSLDRVASMIYGRQPIISLSKHFVPALPQAVDDVYIRDGGNHPEHTPSTNAFFLGTVRLYLVMDDVMEQFQDISRRSEAGQTPACSSLEILMAVLKSDEKLLAWHSSLPECIRFSLHYTELYEPSQPRWIQRCKTILKNRFLGLRILLHRQTILFLLQTTESTEDAASSVHVYHWPPLFSDFIHGQASWDTSIRPESDLERPLAYLSAQICIRSAQQQIDTISICRPTHLTGAWWWDFHFNFDALCVLLGAAGLSPDHRASVILDVAAVHGTIGDGLKTIHSLVSLGGQRARQSEYFLRQLHKVAYTTVDEGPTAWPRSGISKNAEMSPNGAVAAAANAMPAEDIGNSQSLDTWSAANILAGSALPDAAVAMGDSRCFPADMMGNLLHSSFSWNAFDYLSETSQDLEYGSEMVGSHV